MLEDEPNFTPTDLVKPEEKREARKLEILRAMIEAAYTDDDLQLMIDKKKQELIDRYKGDGARKILNNTILYHYLSGSSIQSQATEVDLPDREIENFVLYQLKNRKNEEFAKDWQAALNMVAQLQESDPRLLERRINEARALSANMKHSGARQVLDEIVADYGDPITTHGREE